MASKKEVSTVSWKESLKELGVEMLVTIKTSLIILGVLIIILLGVVYVPKLFEWVMF